MQQAILKTLKDANGTYSFPGGASKVVDLFCNGEKVKITEVIINNLFIEYNSFQTGRIHALKLTSTCGTVYVLASAKDIESLQSCCAERLNYQVGLGCTPTNGSTVTVFDVLGNSIGTVTNPTQFVDLWNANANNQIVGTLYALAGWTLRLNFISGNVTIPSLQCSVATVVYTCPTGNTITSPGGGALRVVFTAAANKNYTVYVWNNSGGTSLRTSQTSNNVTGSPVTKTIDFTNLPGGTYYAEVRETPSSTPCSLTSQVVAAPPARNVEWEWFDNEPTDLAGATYTHTQSHVLNADISVSITGMGADKWFVLRYPSDETNPVAWFNTNLNQGSIPDSVFNSATTISSWKYLKTKVSVTFDNTQPVIFTH